MIYYLTFSLTTAFVVHISWGMPIVALLNLNREERGLAPMSKLVYIPLYLISLLFAPAFFIGLLVPGFSGKIISNVVRDILAAEENNDN